MLPKSRHFLPGFVNWSAVASVGWHIQIWKLNFLKSLLHLFIIFLFRLHSRDPRFRASVCISHSSGFAGWARFVDIL